VLRNVAVPTSGTSPENVRGLDAGQNLNSGRVYAISVQME
jgi:hypothetical protein